MRTKKLNNKGFTLVEVIVVAVIVAVLALVGIQLYTGYVQDARTNTAENLAASAAGYLTTERNRGAEGTPTVGADGTISGWTTAATGQATTFTVPDNAALTIGDNTVSATVGTGGNQGVSSVYNW